MVHVSLMFLSEWCEFRLAPYLAGGKKTWWQLASQCCWNHARHLTCFLSASVTRKDLQFGTWTNPYFQRHYQFRLRHQEVGRAVDLSASPCKNICCLIVYLNLGMLLHPWWNEKCIYQPQIEMINSSSLLSPTVEITLLFFKTLQEKLRSHVIRCCSHVIRCHVWPLFPWFNTCVFHFWVRLKDKIYKTYPHILVELRNGICREISTISGQDL